MEQGKKLKNLRASRFTKLQQIVLEPTSPFKDCYNVKGQCRKINLYLDYEDALTLADDDINENWEIYRERFLRGDFP